MSKEEYLVQVYGINEGTTIIEFYLPDGEILREAKPELVNKLKELGLHRAGEQFMISFHKEDNGEYTFKVEKHEPVMSEKVKQMYAELLEEIN